MKKGAILLSIFLVLAIGIVSAANETTTAFSDKAFTCLETNVKGKCSSLSFEQQVFSILALGYNSNIQSECKTSLKKLGTSCFPSSSCKVKDTALALLALKNSGEDVTNLKSWLLNHNSTSDLEWYLEIDSSKATTCTISYDGTPVSITINDNKKITSFSNSCLSPANSNYWMRISDSCVKKTFTVTCADGFVSTILYKKPSSNVWHITSDVQSASANGKTTHQINAYCLSTSTSCSYEDNLWAALALQKSSQDIKPMIPYLTAYSEGNENYFPDTFLYILTSSTENRDKILTSEQTDGSWKINSQYYDTALALLSLSGESQTKAKDWLQSVQGNDGCWNSANIRDTAILLWAGWPKPAASSGSSSVADCEDYNHYCMTSSQCLQVNGTQLNNFDCSGRGGIKVCCDKPQQQLTCSQQGGIICSSGQSCSISTISTYDTSNCCTGTCGSTAPSACENAGYFCRSSCLSGEDISTLICSSAQVCCQPTVKKSYWWVWLLIILIILVVLGILFRNRLRVLLFKFRGGVGSQPVNKSRPGFPPAGFRPMQPMQRRPSPYPAPRQQTQSEGKKSDELEETLKKLREMSK